ncbi:MAG TPA: BrnA antitoxin family protein [Acidocella sp.]|nr:BrnA antitoxin family protein [Acidocella sp.]
MEQKIETTGEVIARGLKPDERESVTLELDSNLVSELRMTGHGWQRRVETVLAAILAGYEPPPLRLIPRRN